MSPATEPTPAKNESQLKDEKGEAQPSLSSSVRQHEPSPRPTERQHGTSPSTAPRLRQDSSHSQDVIVSSSGALERLERETQEAKEKTLLKKEKAFAESSRNCTRRSEQRRRHVAAASRELEAVGRAERIADTDAASTPPSRGSLETLPFYMAVLCAWDPRRETSSPPSWRKRSLTRPLRSSRWSGLDQRRSQILYR